MSVTYSFHCKEYEQECSFKQEPTDEVLMDMLDDFCLSYGYGVDEVDELVEGGDAGYYEI